MKQGRSPIPAGILVGLTQSITELVCQVPPQSLAVTPCLAALFPTSNLCAGVCIKYSPRLAGAAKTLQPAY